jgi:WXG100 family type VII secretion target
MASGSYGTTTAVMQQCSAQIEQVSQSINSQLNSLMNQLQPVASTWKGSASSAFQQLMERWQSDATKLTQALNSISEMMGTSSKNYAASEEQNTSAISNILGTLN